MQPNLEAGKILIDQLEMIEAKTQGNLSAQESAILEDALKNVRLAFVEVSGGTPASMMPKSNMPEFPLEDELEDEPAPRAPEKPDRTSQPSARCAPPGRACGSVMSRSVAGAKTCLPPQRPPAATTTSRRDRGQ